MTQKDYEAAMETRPALREIEKILGNGASPNKKMKLFEYAQSLVGAAIQRVFHDMGMVAVRKPKE